MSYLHRVKNIFMKLWYECDKGAHKPERAHDADAGLDLYMQTMRVTERCELFDRVIYTRYEIDTGVHFYIPEGFVGLVLPRSSMSRGGYLTHTGVIDSGYTGTIRVFLTAFGDVAPCQEGQRIAQIVILPINAAQPVLKSITSMVTERGEAGFGSTVK
jgi:dUTP pyrophosphatase